MNTIVPGCMLPMAIQQGSNASPHNQPQQSHVPRVCPGIENEHVLRLLLRNVVQRSTLWWLLRHVAIDRHVIHEFRRDAQTQDHRGATRLRDCERPGDSLVGTCQWHWTRAPRGNKTKQGQIKIKNRGKARPQETQQSIQIIQENSQTSHLSSQSWPISRQIQTSNFFFVPCTGLWHSRSSEWTLDAQDRPAYSGHSG